MILKCSSENSTIEVRHIALCQK